MALKRTLRAAISHWQLAVLTLSVLAGYVSAQEGGAELRLSAMRANGEYLLGEPVSVQVLLINNSTKPVNLLALLAPRYGDLVVEISNDGGTFKSYVGPGSTMDVFSRPRVFRPGDQASEVVTILWNHPIPGSVDHIQTDLAFVQEGHYWVRARLTDLQPMRPSNALEIVMKNPTGDDAEVWKLLRDMPRLAGYLQDPRPDKGGADGSQLEEILRKYPRSSYAPYIRAALEKAAAQKKGARLPGDPRS